MRLWWEREYGPNKRRMLAIPVDMNGQVSNAVPF